jgi:hypothetical protein
VGKLFGRADFLKRVERPSKLGSFSYEVQDTKLARSPKAKFVVGDGALTPSTPIARPVVPSCWRAWLHLASLVEERGDLPGYPLVFLDLAVVVDEVHE